ncbi:MAG: membrane or secreted protein [Acidobacteria bacterium]|nr:membrane or secreted protein [Acidobacteriota bacterium]
MIHQLFLAVLFTFNPPADPADLTGAWQSVDDSGNISTLIMTDGHFSVAVYKTDPNEFVSTRGGKWTMAREGVAETTYEYHTADPEMVGTTHEVPFSIRGDELMTRDVRWTRIDDGTPGDLEGAWLITGQKRDGEIRTRTPGARRTMKILSGTRFQWIAFNVDTKEFFGTGGGTYTTENGRYVENIEFFSRDNARAGMSLEFGYDLVDGVWHHEGKSTAGNPMYELWTPRSVLGI